MCTRLCSALGYPCRYLVRRWRIWRDRRQLQEIRREMRECYDML